MLYLNQYIDIYFIKRKRTNTKEAAKEQGKRPQTTAQIIYKRKERSKQTRDVQ